MPHGPLKAAGEYTVVVGLHTDVAIEVAVQVLGETA
jgi:ribosomal protein L9